MDSVGTIIRNYYFTRGNICLWQVHVRPENTIIRLQQRNVYTPARN